MRLNKIRYNKIELKLYNRNYFNAKDLFALEIEAFEAKHTGGGAATEKNSNFHLKASNVIMNAVGVCWTPKNVFLRPLTQKFWKLTLQIIAR